MGRTANPRTRSADEPGGVNHSSYRRKPVSKERTRCMPLLDSGSRRNDGGPYFAGSRQTPPGAPMRADLPTRARYEETPSPPSPTRRCFETRLRDRDLRDTQGCPSLPGLTRQSIPLALHRAETKRHGCPDSSLRRAGGAGPGCPGMTKGAGCPASLCSPLRGAHAPLGAWWGARHAAALLASTPHPAQLRMRSVSTGVDFLPRGEGDDRHLRDSRPMLCTVSGVASSGNGYEGSH
jgi:hypothetical protein